MSEEMAQGRDGGSVASMPPRTRSRVCLECGLDFQPAREWHRHCSDACRAKGWKARQRTLDFAPAGWTPAQRELSAHLRKRESRKARMLARLRQGEATTWELMQLGGSGWRSRLQELREDGHKIPSPENRLDYAIYRLEEP